MSVDLGYDKVLSDDSVAAVPLFVLYSLLPLQRLYTHDMKSEDGVLSHRGPDLGVYIIKSGLTSM